METITIGQIAGGVAFLVAFFTGISYLLKNIKSVVSKTFKEELKPINEAMEELKKQVEQVDLETCKNYLVMTISDIEQGEKLTEVEHERFFEQYAHYLKIGGNTYIKKRIEKLEKDGKI